MIGGRAAAAVEVVRAGVDALLSEPLDASELPELLVALEVERRRLEAVDQRALSEFAAAGHADSLATLLCIDQREARSRLKRAGDLGPRRALTGEPLEPILPTTAAAVALGEVSAAQADVIIDCLERVPPSASAAAWQFAEQVLVDTARVEPPRALRRTAIAVLARLDPDGLEPVEEKLERRRAFTLVHHRDGSATPRGSWTAEATALWEAVLDSLAAPQSTEDHPDARSAAQRRHDAMIEAARRLLRSGELPAAGGVPVTVLATTTMSELAVAAGVAAPERDAPLLDLGLQDLAARAGLELGDVLGADTAGLAVLGHGQTISARALLTLACEAQVVPVVFDDSGGVACFGNARRLASRGQRLALVARDGGCSFPGCDRPAAWTEVHHVTPWVVEPRTDIDNLCLVCAYHHRSFEKAGWDVRMRDGVPEWLPPPWVDPQRRPRRNTAHHPPEITFRRPAPAA